MMTLLDQPGGTEVSIMNGETGLSLSGGHSCHEVLVEVGVGGPEGGPEESGSNRSAGSVP